MTNEEMFQEFNKMSSILSKEINNAGNLRYVYLEKKDAAEALMMVNILKVVMEHLGDPSKDLDIDEMMEKVLSGCSVDFDEFDNLGPDIGDDITSADYSEIKFDNKPILEPEGDDHVRQQ